ncbi:hypothetical protein Tco_1172795 [Tanacetum coccineum]
MPGFRKIIAYMTSPRNEEDDWYRADRDNLDTQSNYTIMKDVKKNLEESRPKRNSNGMEGSKLDRGYAGRASTIQATIKVKTASTLMETQKPLLKDEDGEE